MVDEMGQRVLTTEPEHTDSHVLDGGAGGLSMYQVTVHERVLQQWRNSVYVIFTHLTNVLEQKWERFQHTVLHIQFGHAIFVHESGKYCERRTRLRYDGNGHGSADTILSLLYFQIVQ